jgi:4-hydroxybenzoate polyprenyltransferase
MKELDTRSKLLYSTAVVGFVAGWVITFWGFHLPPQGVIDNTVIVVLGQAMTYSAGAFGVDKFIDYKIDRKKRRKEENET